MSRRNIIGGAVLALLLASRAFAQPGVTRGYNHPLDKPITDAEFAEAISSPRGDVSFPAIERAKLLPPHTLSDSSIKAVSDLIILLRNEDLKLVRESAPGSLREGDSHFEDIIHLAELLVAQKNPAGVDGLAAIVHFGPPILYALVGYGEAAVPALLQHAFYPGDEPGSAQHALDALRQIHLNHKVSPQSLAGLKQVATQWLDNAKRDDDVFTLNEAVYLAVATGDPTLRRRVVAFTRGDREFVDRGISPEWQHVVQEGAKKALAETK